MDKWLSWGSSWQGLTFLQCRYLPQCRTADFIIQTYYKKIQTVFYFYLHCCVHGLFLYYTLYRYIYRWIHFTVIFCLKSNLGLCYFLKLHHNTVLRGSGKPGLNFSLFFSCRPSKSFKIQDCVSIAFIALNHILQFRAQFAVLELL